MNLDFFRGWIAVLCIESLVQDCLGRERYIDWLQSWGWCPAWISVPIVLGVLVLIWRTRPKTVTREED